MHHAQYSGWHSQPPRLEPLNHIIRASPVQGRQSRVAPRSSEVGPAASQLRGPRPALRPAPAPPVQRPPCSRRSSVTLDVRARLQHRASGRRPGVPPPRCPARAGPTRDRRRTGPGRLTESPRRGGRAPQPPAQAQQRGPRPPHRGRRRRPREQRPPQPRRRWRRNWGAGLRGREPSSSPIRPTPSIS